ncbi:MAG: polymer-forming cytoskeletal protein [Clostridiales bacterium]|nr:polymer-forming cytoskeletal protein [Clostridiales bacterium]
MRRRIPARPDHVDTILGPGTILKGTLQCQGAVRVEGQLEGSIAAEGDVYIAETARVKADIAGRHVALAGVVVGNVHARERLLIGPKGLLQGDFYAPKLVVEEGGRFEGQARMTGNDDAAPEGAAREP